MTYINLFTTLNQISHFSLNISNDFVEVTNATSSSFILLSLLLVSLGLTFHSKGTTVHKVLGLLLTSIFVVFLWLLQTQFLFIYIVYILAFISAVLMLFLSVVLMLPISTLTSKNLLTDKKNSSKAFIFLSTVAHDSLTTSVTSVAVILSLFLLGYLTKYMTNINIFKVYNNLIEYSKYQFQISSQISNSNLFNYLTLKQVKFNVPSTQSEMSVLGFYSQIGNAIWKMVLKFQGQNTIISQITSNFVTYLALAWTVFGFIVTSVSSFIVKCIQSIRYEVRTGFQLFKTINNLPESFTKVLWDVAVQTYLFITIVLSMTSLFLSKQVILAANTNVLNNESLQGLGQIKSLLYGDFSLFLLFSTVVLLIALLGAAVMTRSKR